jgi:hypothetical protein
MFTRRLAPKPAIPAAVRYGGGGGGGSLDHGNLVAGQHPSDFVRYVWAVMWGSVAAFAIYKTPKKAHHDSHDSHHDSHEKKAQKHH